MDFICDKPIPSIDSTVTLIPQDQKLHFEPIEYPVRTVVHIPTRKTNDFILDVFAQLNRLIDRNEEQHIVNSMG